MRKKWRYLGEGNYNLAFWDKRKKLVYKIPKYAIGYGFFPVSDACFLDSDDPERCARVWNDLNPSLQAPAEVRPMGWVAPFLEGRQSSLSEIKTALIDIYNRTGRVILDPLTLGNFITTEDGTAHCVDVGFAARFQRQTKLQVGKHQRRYSFASDDLFEQSAFIRACIALRTEPEHQEQNKVIVLIRAILFLMYQCPYIDNVSFLASSPALQRKLSKALASYMDGNKEWRVAIAKATVDQLWIERRSRPEEPMSVTQEEELSTPIQYEWNDDYVAFRELWLKCIEKMMTYRPSIPSRDISSVFHRQCVDAVIKDLISAQNLRDIKHTLIDTYKQTSHPKLKRGIRHCLRWCSQTRDEHPGSVKIDSICSTIQPN
jgi:hypothetical protein